MSEMRRDKQSFRHKGESQGNDVIVGAYSLHLYCDAVNNNDDENNQLRLEHRYDYSGWPAEFAGKNSLDARTKAKAVGWKFIRGKCYCPKCAAFKRAQRTRERLTR